MSAADDLFLSPAPRVYSIDAGRPFLVDLASALIAAIPDPLERAAALIFTPTRRAAQALKDAFADAAGGPALLPDIRPIGDVDEEALAVDRIAVDAAEADLPPAVSRLERRLTLARLVAAAEKGFSGRENQAAALAAADELAALLDTLYTEEVNADRLERLAPADCAEHWARSLDFLKIVIARWPEHLAEAGRADPTARRALLIRAEAERLARLDPETPVVVAGTTGSQPATARLMAVVAGLKRGAVVLPGLDRALASDQSGWAAVDDGHPQAGVKSALSALGVEPADVRTFPGSGAPSARAGLMTLALRPAKATEDWLALVRTATRADPGLAAAAKGLELVEASDEEAEAAAVAAMLRGAIERPGARAMLVTPDRNLGRRVAAKMRRWGVEIDDSAGIPLAATALGAFLRLVAAFLAAPVDASRLLAVARSPLAGFGLDADARAASVDALDLALRGPQSAEEFSEWRARITADVRHARAAPAIDALAAAHAAWPQGETAPVRALLDAHLQAAEALASRRAKGGGEILWSGPEGETAAALFAELRATAAVLGDERPEAYPRLFEEMIADVPVRRRRAVHPRLQILGPLEARLQSADLVVLGGLNEGVWPAEPSIDPFLSRRMRKEAGLPSPERRIGLAAHDFATLAAASSAAMTRAKKSGGAPARPSRWLVRLKNILAGAGALGAVDRSRAYQSFAAALDAPAGFAPAARPEPRPPTAARPRRLPVTEFETLIRDPYAVYARRVLGLRPLDDAGLDVGRRELGTLLHAAFEAFVRTGGDPTAPDARARLESALLAHAARLGFARADLALWRERFSAALQWFLDFDAGRRAAGAPVIVEEEGQTALAGARSPFVIYARADRIDLESDGDAAIFDYKSGVAPTLDQVKARFSPQLPLTALIVEAGGFERLGARRVKAFAYLKSLNRKGGSGQDAGAEGDDARRLIDEAGRGAAALADHYDDPDTPYLSQPRPQFLKDFARFDVLARRREWAAAAGEDDGE